MIGYIKFYFKCTSDTDIAYVKWDSDFNVIDIQKLDTLHNELRENIKKIYDSNYDKNYEVTTCKKEEYEQNNSKDIFLQESWDDREKYNYAKIATNCTGCKNLTNGDGNSIDVEEVILEGRVGKVTRLNANEYEVYVDGLKHEPFYDENTVSSRLNARKWCEKMLRNDVKLDKEEI